jgi:micrococcal nuclease
MRQQIWRWIVLSFLLTLAMTSSLVEAEPPMRVSVVHVLDGDTIDVQGDGTRYRIRLIGVDAEELHANLPCAKHWAQEALSVLRALTIDAEVRLVLDLEPRDRYQRWLGYIYLEDGTFVNAALLVRGVAALGATGKNRAELARLRAAQAIAQAEHRGMWAVGDGGISSRPR